MIIKLNKKYLEEFQGCEVGADDDNMIGPSPLTTLKILERHERNIELRSAEEAAQIADAARYGTFELHTSERIAMRVFEEALMFPGAVSIFKKWDSEGWAELKELTK
jgi:hypothetical protein